MSFSRYLQENLLTLLVFDKQNSKIIRNVVEPQLFGGFYKEVVVRIYDFIDKHKVPPGEHVADLLEDKLESENKRERNTYRDILTSLDETKDQINTEFVMSQLEAFIRRQSLRSVAVDLAKALQKDTEDSLDTAESLIKEAGNVRLGVFDPGLEMHEVDRVMRFLDENTHAFPTGIPEFDKRGFGPTRGELFLYIADTKTGKTWSMIHLAKMAIMNNLKVVHVSLEMSETKIAQRYVQTLFAVAKRMEEFKTMRFNIEEDGEVEVTEKVVKPSMALDDKDIHKKLKRKLNKWKDRILRNIIVKQFPTGKLSVAELEAYLDNLLATRGFTPDLIIVDYPDLMRLPIGQGTQYRHALAEVYKLLRGVGVARNCAMACPTQANREAAGAKFVGRKNVSEAYAKVSDADVAITYSQTELEKKLGLARLSVIAGRNDDDSVTVVLSQAYGIGQYALDSVMMTDTYRKEYVEGKDKGDEPFDYSSDDEDED